MKLNPPLETETPEMLIFFFLQTPMLNMWKSIDVSPIGLQQPQHTEEPKPLQ